MGKSILQNKTFLILNASLAIHLFFFSTLQLRISPLSAPDPVRITFLGAILENLDPAHSPRGKELIAARQQTIHPIWAADPSQDRLKVTKPSLDDRIPAPAKRVIKQHPVHQEAPTTEFSHSRQRPASEETITNTPPYERLRLW